MGIQYTLLYKQNKKNHTKKKSQINYLRKKYISDTNQKNNKMKCISKANFVMNQVLRVIKESKIGLQGARDLIFF